MISPRRFTMRTIVTVSTKSASKGEMFVGIFWPQAQYEAKVERKMNQSEAEFYTHNGKKLKGKMLDASEGIVSGCIRVTDVDERPVTKVSTVADTDTNFNKGAVADTFAKAQQSLHKSVVSGTDKETGLKTVGIKQSHKKLLRRNSSSSISDGWIKVLTAPILQKRKAKGEPSCNDSDAATDERDGGGGVPAPSPKIKKARSASSATAARSSPPVKMPHALPATSNVPTPSPKPVYPSMQQRELNSCQSIVSAAEIFIASAANSEGLKTMSVLKTERQLSKISKKLSQEVLRKLTFQRDPESKDIFEVEDSAGDLPKQCDAMANKLKLLHAQLLVLRDLCCAMEGPRSCTARSASAGPRA